MVWEESLISINVPRCMIEHIANRAEGAFVAISISFHGFYKSRLRPGSNVLWYTRSLHTAISSPPKKEIMASPLFVEEAFSPAVGYYELVMTMTDCPILARMIFFRLNFWAIIPWVIFIKKKPQRFPNFRLQSCKHRYLNRWMWSNYNKNKQLPLLLLSDLAGRAGAA